MAHLRGIWPGAKVPVFAVHPGKTGDITTWETRIAKSSSTKADGNSMPSASNRADPRPSPVLVHYVLRTGCSLDCGRSTVFAGRSIVPLAIWSLGCSSLRLGRLELHQ